MAGTSLLLLLLVSSQAYSRSEECASRYGWRGTCKPSWTCPSLADLLAVGYQLELCSPQGPTVCCPGANSLASYPSVQQTYPYASQNYPSVQQSYSSVQQNYPFVPQNYPSAQQSYSSAPQNYPSIQQTYSSSPQNYLSSQQSYSSSPQNYLSSQQSYSSAPQKYPSIQQTYSSSPQNYLSSQQSYSSSPQNYLSSQQSYSSSPQNYLSSQQSYSSSPQNYPSLQQLYTSVHQTYPSAPQTYTLASQQPAYDGNQYEASIPSRHLYNSGVGLSVLKPKRKRFQGAFLKTYIQDEDDNTLVKVTPLRSQMNRKKRKQLSTKLRKSQSNRKIISFTPDHSLQGEQLSFTYEHPQSTSVQKCQEYAVFGYENSVELSPANGVVPSTYEYCPSNSKESTVSDGEFPFMAGLGYEDETGQIFWGCSGTLISQEYVLTAAHCLHPPLGRPKVVRLGTPQLDLRGYGIEVGISEVNLHPLYNPSDRTANIALLRLAPVPQLGVKLRPACLQANATGHLFTPYWVKDHTVTAKLKTEGDDFILIADHEASTLRKSMSAEVSQNLCNVTSPREDYFCVEAISTDSCQSLSEGGEPLIQQDKTNPCLQTVLALAVDKACAPQQPTLYTRIDPYIAWIESIVWA